MKSQLISLTGNKKEIQLPEIFDTPLREDIISKVAEVERFSLMQPYSLSPTAGRRHSASGRIKHMRHKWGTAYGKGISRVPRKTMWRRGTQFYWVGAEVSGARGGRRVHGPSGIKHPIKINKKEYLIALASALASTARPEIISRRYSSLAGKKLSLSLPIILESSSGNVKTKNILSLLKTSLGDLFVLAFKNKVVRAGKGKRRGRKYKSNAGILLVTGNSEKLSIKGLDIKPVNSLIVLDFYPPGRLAIFTEKALKDLEEKYAA